MGVRSPKSHRLACCGISSGVGRAPVLARVDEALSFWAVRGVSLKTLWQVMGSTKRPTSSTPCPSPSISRPRRRSSRPLSDILSAAEHFAGEVGTKWPKFIAKVLEYKVALVAFYKFPAEHWTHLRTTNPVGSSFVPVKVRTDLTKEPRSSEVGVVTTLKLLEATEEK